MISKEDFLKQYCEISDITEEELLKTQEVLPCDCEDIICQGWVVQSKNK